MLLLAFFRAARGARDELREDRDHLLALVVRESCPRSPKRVRVSEPEPLLSLHSIASTVETRMRDPFAARNEAHDDARAAPRSPVAVARGVCGAIGS
jgi:hypothetical protein